MSDEAKILIDEDWKAQVQREREAAHKDIEEPQAAAGDVEGQAEEGHPGMPPASFDTLVASLATEAMLALGLIVPPGQDQVYIDLDSAKFNIDLLEVLREKTKGNLDPTEEGNLTQAVAQMQQAYVARMQQYQEMALRQAGIDPGALKIQ